MSTPTVAVPASRATAARQILVRNLTPSDPAVMRAIPAIVAELEPHLRADPPLVATGRAAGRAELTERERRILALAADGHTNQGIAAQLDKSVDTIKTHMRRIYRKLGAQDRANAVMIAMRAGILQ